MNLFINLVRRMKMQESISNYDSMRQYGYGSIVFFLFMLMSALIGLALFTYSAII